MPIYSGIDEAGLGPILGPFCATSTTIQGPSPLKELLEDQQKKLFYVDDSKKVFQGKYGLQRLEESVLSFYTLLTGSVPKTLKSFIPSLNGEWYNREMTLPLTVSEDHIVENASKIDELFDQRGVKLLDIKKTAISDKSFNSLIDTSDNKSIVCQKIVEPLIKQVGTFANSEITVDKQGGRKFYSDYLNQLFPSDEINIEFEEANHSRYEISDKSISFRAKADSSSFTVALASMFSKYMREIAMTSFNRHWYSLNSDVKPTAGYYTDGVRFLKDLEINSLLPSDMDIIRRKK